MLRRTHRRAAIAAAAFSVLATLSANRAHASTSIFWTGPGSDWADAANWGGNYYIQNSSAFDKNLNLFQSGPSDAYDPTVFSNRSTSAIWFDNSSHTIGAANGATLTLGAVQDSAYGIYSVRATNGATANFSAPIVADPDVTAAYGFTILVNDSSNVTFSGGLTGANSLNIAGNGTTTFASTAHWNGSLNVTGGGHLYLSPNQAITGPYNVFDGTLHITDPSALGSSTLNLGSNSATGTGNLTVNSPSPVTISNDINAFANTSYDYINYKYSLYSGGVITNNAPSLTLAGTVHVGTPNTTDSGRLTFDGPGNTTLSGAISNSQSGVVVKTGSGTLTITHSNSGWGANGGNGYDDLVVQQGTVQLRNGNAIGDHAAVAVYAGGTLDLGGENETIGALANFGNPGGSVTLGSATLTFAGNPVYSIFDGVISGSGSVAVNGDANQVLSGANTYTGHTIISNGALLAGANVPQTGPGPLGNDGLSYVTVGDANTTSGAFVGVYGDNINFAKDIHFTAGPDRTRGIVGYTSNSVISGDLTLSGSDILINPSYNPSYFGEGLTLNGNITGTGGLVIDSSMLGNVILAGNAASSASSRNVTIVGGNLVLVANTPAGASPISLGTAESDSNFRNPGLYARGAITVARDVIVGSKYATLGGAEDANATFSGSINLNGHPLSLYSETTGTNATTFSGPITGTGTLDLASSGNILLSGNNTFSPSGNGSAIILESGTLRFNSDANLGAVPASNAASYILLEGGTLAVNQSTTINSKRGIKVASSTTGSLQVDTGLTLSYGGTISGGNSSSRLAKLGNGTLSLNGATVSTNFQTSAGSVNFIGSTLSSNFTASGGITTFDAASSYTGTMTLNGGITRLTSTSKLSTGKLTVAGGVLETNGSLTRALGTGNNQLAWTSGGFSAVGGDLTLNIGGAGATQTWGSTNFLSTTNAAAVFGSANATGTVTVANGIQLTSSGNATRTIQVDRGTGTAPEAVLSGVISDASGRTGSILKTGAGALLLSNTNTFHGGTTVRNGSLYIGSNDTTGSSGALGTYTGAITIGDSSTAATDNLAFGVYGANVSSNRAITVANKGNQVTLGAFSANNANFSGNVTLGKSVNLTAPAGGSATFSGTLSGAGGITKTGDGTVAVTSAANTFTGKTTVNAGTLVVASLANAGSNSSLGAATGANATIDIGAATLKYTGSGSSTNRAINLTAAGATIDASGSGALSLTGAIGGTGSLTKTGAGSLALTAANTYSGNTTVQQGTLVLGSGASVNNSPKITVNSGATLDVTAKGSTGLTIDATHILLGSGSVLGNLTVNGSVGGTLNVSGSIGGSGSVNPGNSPGILTASSVNPTGGLDFSFEFTQTGSPDYANAAGSGNDVLHLTSSTAPFASALTADNVIDFYLPTLSDATFRGGFFTNLGSGFLASLQNATINYFTLNAGGDVAYNGEQYSRVDPRQWTLSLTTVADTAFFDGVHGTNGFVTQISATSAAAPVPLPSAAAMGLVVLPALALSYRRRRKQQS